MKIQNANTSIVLAGSWNQQILTPKWLKNNKITDQEKIQIEVAINNPSLPIRYKLENVYLNISQQKVIIYPIEETEDSYDSAECIAIQLLEKLIHTPIIGIGYNFQFTEEKPDKKIVDRFIFTDEEIVNNLRGTVKERVIKRKLSINDKLLNLTMSLDSKEALIVDFNWHFDSDSAIEAKDQIKDTFFKTYKETKEIVEKMFTE
jgi:hypothetical protein